jgi:hypothetical protein
MSVDQTGDEASAREIHDLAEVQGQRGQALGDRDDRLARNEDIPPPTPIGIVDLGVPEERECGHLRSLVPEARP